MSAPMIAALDSFMLAQTTDEPLVSRPDAVRYALRDWLVGHGYLRHREDPEGAN